MKTEVNHKVFHKEKEKATQLLMNYRYGLFFTILLLFSILSSLHPCIITKVT